MQRLALDVSRPNIDKTTICNHILARYFCRAAQGKNRIPTRPRRLVDR